MRSKKVGQLSKHALATVERMEITIDTTSHATVASTRMKTGQLAVALSLLAKKNVHGSVALLLSSLITIIRLTRPSTRHTTTYHLKTLLSIRCIAE